MGRPARRQQFHKLGRKTFQTDMPGCRFWVMANTTCNVYWGNCVFNGAMTHKAVKATAANTSVINSLFASMHDAFGYGLKEGQAVEDWWHISLPAYGFGSTMYGKDMGY